MIPRCTAWLLILLAASPFTAPFSTCDLSTLMDTVQPATHAADKRAHPLPAFEPPGAQPMILDEQFKDTTLTDAATAAPVFVKAVTTVHAAPRTSGFRAPLVILRL